MLAGAALTVVLVLNHGAGLWASSAGGAWALVSAAVGATQQRAPVLVAGAGTVSSCLIAPEITAGHHVAKGDELEHFQFGGSTHCLAFRPGAIADFRLGALPQPENLKAPLVLVPSKLATATTTT
ncbi:MAG TPA: hypothetical protein VLQ79_11730 [Myxococcaceae bacterium]|nr:hypothetical protein [Myxococcaceae bacterium]